MDHINEAKVSYYLSLTIVILWSILTLNHFSRDLNWMPLVWMYPPMIALLFYARKEMK